MLWAGRDQSGGCHLVGYDDSIVPLSPIPLLLLAYTATKLCFFTVTGDATDFDVCLRFGASVSEMSVDFFWVAGCR